MSDTEYMKLAIKLAKKGAGYVNPNPMVGAVIVKDNRIIGQGYHEIFGGLHAERNALKNCRESPVGATLYVTLEPCAGNFYDVPGHYIRRVNPEQRYKDTCMFCNVRNGYDYYIGRKNK